MNLNCPPGFQGLDFNSPIDCYTRKLPHWRQVGATYFVTFRLADSLPQQKLKSIKASFRMRQHAPTAADQEKLTRELMTKIERWLDQGVGACHLRIPRFAEIVESSLHFFDGTRYQLWSYVVMPNHVHLLVKPLVADQMPLESIIQSWKRHTAKEINTLAGRTGIFWQSESFDRIIRDEEHLYKAIQYIGNNPTLAQLGTNEFKLWIRPEWESAGWKFRQT